MDSVIDLPETQLSASEQSIARSRVYFLLATGFTFPTVELYAQYADGSYAEDLVSVLAASAPDLLKKYGAAILDALATDASFEDFEAAYLSAFETNMPTPSASLYEGSYVHKNNRPALLLEIKGFYNNFDLVMDASVNDLEDTLTAELEFMQFLTAKQAQAEDNGSAASAAYQLAQRDFLQRHLAAWLPSFNAAVAGQVRNRFFQILAQLVNDFVALDFHEAQRQIAGA